MSNEQEFKTDKYGRFVRDGDAGVAEDFVTIPMAEFEHLKTVEECWNKTIEKTTARTIYDLQREVKTLRMQQDTCNVCPYKQAVQCMMNAAKSK